MHIHISKYLKIKIEEAMAGWRKLCTYDIALILYKGDNYKPSVLLDMQGKFRFMHYKCFERCDISQLSWLFLNMQLSYFYIS
jgi:hypothetical protein